MADNSTVVVIPTNSVTIYLNKQAGQSVTYSNLIALGTYLALAADTYSQLQNLGPTNAEVVVISTNAITIFLGKEQQLATYLSIFAAYGTLYSSIVGKTYATLGVVP